MSEKFSLYLDKNPALIPAIIFGVLIAFFYPTPSDIYSGIFVKVIATITAVLIGYGLGKIIFPTFRRCTQKCHQFSQYGNSLKTHFTLNEL
jgi:hypothetical protein